MRPGEGSSESEQMPSDDARAELMVELAEAAAPLQSTEVVSLIDKNPQLHVMMTKLAEAGDTLKPAVRDHLRRMIALWIGLHKDDISETDVTGEFYIRIIAELAEEMEDMSDFDPDLDDLPEEWELAYTDLVFLEEPDLSDDIIDL